MPSILSALSALDPRRRIIVAGATLAMFVAILALTRLATAPGMALLYAGIEPGAAGEVVSALEQQGVTYEVRGDSIFVDARHRDEMRMTLAADGLPANATAGYELLDRLSGFGTTSQMFDAAYWRAREGELARTIVASPHVRAARVHIAARDAQPFRSTAAPTASVSVTPASGSLTPAQARAIQHLVAAAVAGLAPGDVSVIDAASGLAYAAEEAGASAGAGSAADREDALRRSVERILEARVGRGNAIVEVTVDTVSETETITERRVDPDSRVAISSESEERSSTSNQTGTGAVTVASNLPEGDAAGGGDRSQSQDSETRERVNYEVSETLREVERGAGAVRRISVAVLIEGLRSTDAAGAEVWEPRPAEELAALEDLVASAIGFDAERGDVITVRSLEFLPVEPAGSLAEQGWMAGLDLMSLAQIAVLALVTLILGLFVIRPILTSGAARADLPAPARTLRGLPAAADSGAASAALTGEIDDGTYAPETLPALAAGAGGAPGAASAGAEDPVLRLRRLIGERREETVEILRGWMEDRDEAEEKV